MIVGVLLLILMILWSRKSLYDAAKNVANLEIVDGPKFMIGTTDGPGGNEGRLVIDVIDVVPPRNTQMQPAPPTTASGPTNRSTYAMRFY